jgi:NADH-quinone oxidoreductase subunit A
VSQYLPLVVLAVLAVAFAAISFVASGLLAPRKPTVAKALPYESGIVPDHDPPRRFPVGFYLVAMIFIVFDIELVFFFPWVLIHRELALFGLVAMLIFAVAVFESFLYLLSKGALDWGPVARVEPQDTAMVGGHRTAATTVRRVGLEGRPGQEAGV